MGLAIAILTACMHACRPRYVALYLASMHACMHAFSDNLYRFHCMPWLHGVEKLYIARFIAIYLKCFLLP